MEFALVVYAISVIGKLQFALQILLVVSSVVLLAHCIYVDFSFDKSFKDDFRKKFLITPIVFLTLLTVIPSEHTMYLMAGAYASQAVAQSDLAKDVVQILEIKVKEQLKDLQSTKKD